MASVSEALDGTYRASRCNHRIKVKKPTWQAMKAVGRLRALGPCYNQPMRDAVFLSIYAVGFTGYVLFVVWYGD